MLTIFNTKSIYIGTDMKKFNEVREVLEQKKIKYKYKVKNRMGQWAGNGTIRGKTGSLGTSSQEMYEYEILVHKNDADKFRD